MQEVLQQLRSILEQEMRSYGFYLPLDEPSTPPPARPAAGPSRPASPPAPPPEADPAAAPSPEEEVDTATMDLFGNKQDPSNDPSLSPYERVNALIPEDSPLRAMRTLQEVEAFTRENELIPLDKDRINPVFGVGDPEAGVMVIGEAPGADEDRHGEPFVGRAGQLLNKILEAIQFKREDVYITNILKSRPPGNRDPEPEEIAGHIPILYKQIAIIRPKIILCVGKTAGNALLNRRSSLGALRDKVHDFHGIPVVVTYHPAALLRNPQWKRPTWEDVKLLRTRYDQLVNL